MSRWVADQRARVAIVARTLIHRADHDAHDRLQDAVERTITSQGGPPHGLMVHIGHPDKHSDGFAIVEVWRSEADLRLWWVTVMDP